MTLPFARPVFEVASHLSWEWLLIAVLSLTPVTVVEFGKLLRTYFVSDKALLQPNEV